MANSVDPNQTPRFVAADVGLLCLPKAVYPNTLDMYGISHTAHYTKNRMILY